MNRLSLLLAVRVTGLVLCGLGLMYLCVASTMVAITRDRQPALALRFMSSDPTARVNQGYQELMQALQKGAVSSESAVTYTRLAREALAKEPLNPRALGMLGAVLEVREGTKAAMPLMLLSESLSRRDLLTQFWLIEARSAAGDVPGTLRHYDIALVTRPESWDTLMPILASAIADPEIRAAIVPYVRGQRLWVAQLLVTAMATDPKSVAQLAIAAGSGRSFDEKGTVLITLFQRLGEDYEWSIARDLYLRQKDASPTVLAAADFSAASVIPTYRPLTWATNLNANVAGFIEGEGRASHMILSAAPFANGVAAKKAIFLPSGRHRIAVDYGWANADTDATATLRVQCADKAGAEFVAFGLPPKARQAAAEFVVPAACGTQMISVEIKSQDAVPGDLTIAAIRTAAS